MAALRRCRHVAIVAAAKFSEHFEWEARAVASLNHPHICTLYDVGPNYLVLEFIEGPTIEQTSVKFITNSSRSLNSGLDIQLTMRRILP
jgi:serine/threonine protein kinase